MTMKDTWMMFSQVPTRAAGCDEQIIEFRGFSWVINSNENTQNVLFVLSNVTQKLRQFSRTLLEDFT